MKQKTVHTIQKELIEVMFPDFETARNWETNGRKPFVDITRQVLEEAFAQYDRIPSYLIMDKLVLDLGTFSKDTLLKELPDRLRRELEKALRNLLPSRNYDSKEVRESEYLEDNNQQIEHQILTGPKAKLESFLYYLVHGRLPWWATEGVQWNEALLNELSQDAWSQLRMFLLENKEPAIARIAVQFNDAFVARILLGIQTKIDRIEANDAIASCNWLELIIEMKKREFASQVTSENKSISTGQEVPSQQLIRKRYWMQWFNHILSGETIPQLTSLFKDYSSFIDWIISNSRSQDFFSKTLQLEKADPLIWKRQIEDLINRKNSKLPSLPSSELRPPSSELSPPSSEIFEDDKLVEDRKAQQKRSGKKPTQVEEGEKIFIRDAGLVILNPFLPQLFQHFGLLEKNNFIDVIAQTKAIHLLNFLARGEAPIVEYEALLAKILCGTQWEVPLEPIDPLSDEEMSEANDLLVQVIKYWKELRNTSPDGLRQAFLQREGKLEFNNSTWKLLVEGKAQDVLLSRLPWGFSIIKYPWMNAMLSVSWT